MVTACSEHDSFSVLALELPWLLRVANTIVSPYLPGSYHGYCV